MFHIYVHDLAFLSPNGLRFFITKLWVVVLSSSKVILKCFCSILLDVIFCMFMHVYMCVKEELCYSPCLSLFAKRMDCHCTSSSHMRVMNHNWSATKRRFHPKSVAEMPPFSFVRGQDSTMWNIVWVSPQGHRSVSEVAISFCRHRTERKRFSRDHCCRGRLKPGCRIVGSHISWELTTWADFQLCLHRLLMSTGCKSSHSGFLHVSRMQVEHTADCFGGAWLKSPLSTEVWHPRHIWRESAFQFAEVLALNGETCRQRKWIFGHV